MWFSSNFPLLSKLLVDDARHTEKLTSILVKERSFEATKKQKLVLSGDFPKNFANKLLSASLSS